MNPAQNVVRLVEVLGPAEQGQTTPFRCKGEDGLIYYVKGGQTNRSSLWAEWICGHLAQKIGLPLARFRLVQLDELLCDELTGLAGQIGSDPAFGSVSYPGTTWFERDFSTKIPVALQRDILAFDWWIKNGDRTAGNTNLLWDPVKKALVVIDRELSASLVVTTR